MKLLGYINKQRNLMGIINVNIFDDNSIEINCDESYLCHVDEMDDDQLKFILLDRGYMDYFLEQYDYNPDPEELEKELNRCVYDINANHGGFYFLSQAEPSDYQYHNLEDDSTYDWIVNNPETLLEFIQPIAEGNYYLPEVEEIFRDWKGYHCRKTVSPETIEKLRNLMDRISKHADGYDNLINEALSKQMPELIKGLNR